MTPDDPRHGTEAGHEQHCRDGEDSCPPCHQAKIIAARRRTKRKTMGYKYTAPVGATAVDKIGRLLNLGATYEDIGRWAGISESQVFRAYNQGAGSIVYARTRVKLEEFTPGPILTPAGMTRRIQALLWLGYSCSVIAAESGVHLDTIKDARDRVRSHVAKRVETAVADCYDRLHMQLPRAVEQYERASVTRSRNYARKHGFLPPLAWTLIDDPNESPTGWQYTPATRHELLTDLTGQGFGLTETCRHLGISADALQKWCARNNLSDVYRQLAAGEALESNQHTGRGAA